MASVCTYGIVLMEVTIMRKKFTTTFDEDILKDIKIQAIKENLSVSELIEKIFINYIENIVETFHD